MWELYAMWAWLLIYVRSSMNAGLSVSMASLITFAAIAAGVVGCIGGGFLSDRFGRTATTAAFMAISGTCCVLVGLVFDGPTWLLLTVVVIWGITIIADSPLFSAAVTELSERSLVGTVLSMQMGLGFALTVLVIWLVPQIADWLGSWKWTFAFLAPGPFIGAIAMLRLRSTPAALRLAGGRR